MNNKVILCICTFFLCFFSFATTNMYVKNKNGNIIKFDVNDVEMVVFDDYVSDDSTISDTFNSPLKFRVLRDSTAEVIADDSYKDFDSVIIPAKVRINGIVYDVSSIGTAAFKYCFSLENIEF
ncbi:MAG: hypothetical protein J5614_01710, partial [Paludibacteraceae bacterium]|nr:hypothetical protein [Paludibacteraceae bacterium]